jgi:diacylglycerol kinase (ATP)
MIKTKRLDPLLKTRVALQGLKCAVLTDFAVAYKVALSLPVLAIALIQHQWINVGLLLVVTALVLMAEIFNTVIESLCDVIESGHSEAIGAIKDMAAAAVAVGILAWCAVLIFDVILLL